MKWRKSILFNVMLGALTCFLLVSFSTPLLSKTQATFNGLPEATNAFNSGAIVVAQQPEEALHSRLTLELLDAETSVMAQATPGMSSSPMQRYVVTMTKTSVVPSMPDTAAFGSAGAVLLGNRLVVRGDFSNLSSPFRDFTKDPTNPPNPSITSAVHIHRGEPTANGPFQYALQVQAGANPMMGRFQGDYTLTDEQLSALNSGKLYLDMHTQKNRGGELRGTFTPYGN